MDQAAPAYQPISPKGGVILSYLELLRETQFLARERLLKHQRALLEQLVRHARAHVPFYRDSGRLAPLFRRDDTIDWERWGEIPLLTRREVQANYAALQSERLDPAHGGPLEASTSGSTGEPVRVMRTDLSAIAVLWGQMLRDFEKHRIDPTRRLAFLAPPAPDFVRGAPPKRRCPWFHELGELALLGERFDVADTQPAAELIEIVAALKPSYLWAQSIALQLICAHDRHGRLVGLGIEAVLSVGERFAPEAKREVMEHLGCRIVDQYGSVECGRIAASCAYCGRFHVDIDVHKVEVIGDDGRPTPEGEVGWVIVTPLYNFAMPLIRYDHADQARVGVDGGCRVTLPVFDEIFGKERTHFRFPGGVTLRPVVSTKAIIDLLGAQAFQLAQVAADRCEFRIVPGGLPPTEMRFEEMTRLLRATLWDKLEVDYRIVDVLPRRSPRGKVPAYVYEVPERAARAEPEAMARASDQSSSSPASQRTRLRQNCGFCAASGWFMPIGLPPRELSCAEHMAGLARTTTRPRPSRRAAAFSQPSETANLNSSSLLAKTSR